MEKKKEITKKQMEADRAIEKGLKRATKEHKKTMKNHYKIMQMIEDAKK